MRLSLDQPGIGVKALSDMVSLVAQTAAVAGLIQAHLAVLPAEDWDRPSACTDWSVRHVAAHLAGMGQQFAGSIERGLQGDASPPADSAGGSEAARAARMARIARMATLPPAELLGEVQRGLGRLGRALEASVAANRPETPTWHRLGLMPLAWWPGQSLVEVSLHDWDIRVATNPEAIVAPVALPGLAGEMRARMPRCFKPKSPEGLDGVIQVSLVGEAPSAWLGRLRAGALEVLDDGVATPDARIETDAGSYALVQTTRRPVEWFTSRGRWQVTGNQTLAKRLTAAFSGY
jgi:uncharacterized protein (TIGR03083 family)